MLNEEEKALVCRLASGEAVPREDAESIYHKHIKEHVEGGRKSPEMNFLSEHFNTCPDYVLKSMYRKQVLAQK